LTLPRQIPPSLVQHVASLSLWGEKLKMQPLSNLNTASRPVSVLMFVVVQLPSADG